MYFISLLALAGTSLFAVSGVQAGGFKASCSSYYLSGNNIMYATCKNFSGADVNSSLNLNACIGNDGVNLVCKANGNYAVSCSACVIRTGSYMRCQCPTGSGIVDLNDCVGNNNGLLVC